MSEAPVATPAYVRSTTDTTVWEPFVVGGKATGEVHWLRTTAADSERTLLTGLWRSEPRTFAYPFAADETVIVLDGELLIEYPDGETLTMVPGDIASFTKDTVTTWTVVKSFKKLFVING
ncbi:cupin domain-containing protein [Streptomyces sp. NPDC087420]|uniref:cupin domain-containing protein n=1 Tax=Streptomyces sp. NPDC087420 TaxID=3365785 RepID=UPI003834592C